MTTHSPKSSSNRFIFYLLPLAFYLCFLSSCVPNAGKPIIFHAFEDEVAKISAQVYQGESVAVTWIYNSESGDINGLGNLWRDRLESALKSSNLRVKARKDIVLLVDDLETFGKNGSEKAIWKNAGAEIIICGDYRIIQPRNGNKSRISLTIKALRIADSTLVGTIFWEEELPDNWPRLAARSKGNALYKKIESVVGAGADKPFLQAKFKRESACYPSGALATMKIETEPGVYLYILSLGADYTASLLSPNTWVKDQPLLTGRFIFPPLENVEDFQLELTPINKYDTDRAAFKIVASRNPIDFSFLPEPIDEIKVGDKGGEMKKMLKTLKNARNWNEKVLTYRVGPECR